MIPPESVDETLRYLWLGHTDPGNDSRRYLVTAVRNATKVVTLRVRGGGFALIGAGFTRRVANLAAHPGVNFTLVATSTSCAQRRSRNASGGDGGHPGRCAKAIDLDLTRAVDVVGFANDRGILRDNRFQPPLRPLCSPARPRRHPGDHTGAATHSPSPRKSARGPSIVMGD